SRGRGFDSPQLHQHNRAPSVSFDERADPTGRPLVVCRSSAGQSRCNRPWEARSTDRTGGAGVSPPGPTGCPGDPPPNAAGPVEARRPAMEPIPTAVGSMLRSSLMIGVAALLLGSGLLGTL